MDIRPVVLLLERDPMSRRYTHAIIVACEKFLLGNAAERQPDGRYIAANVDAGHDSLVAMPHLKLIHETTTRKRNLGKSQSEVVGNVIKQIDIIIGEYSPSSSAEAEEECSEWRTLRYELMGILERLETPASVFQLTITLPPRWFSLTRA